MSNKLATKHKSSLTLKSPIKKSLLVQRKKYSDDYEYGDDGKDFKITIFPSLFCIIFFVHWIVVCPLIWALLYRTQFSEGWPRSWPYLFWIVAFLIWLTVMIALIILWRGRKKRRERDLLNPSNVVEQSGPTYRTNVEAVQPEVIQLRRSSWKKNSEDSIDQKREESKRDRRKKLAPLVIHQSMTGLEKTENKGDVSIETPNETDRGSMKKYLKLVTVQTPFTPESPVVGDRNSSEAPMSPRELFFIDMIREAEKIEDKYGTRNSPFFDEQRSEYTQEAREVQEIQEAQEAREIQEEKEEQEAREIQEEREEQEAREIQEEREEKEARKIQEEREEQATQDAEYFIANVNTPVKEINEIFIEIESREEKPRLILASLSAEQAEN